MVSSPSSRLRMYSKAIRPEQGATTVTSRTRIISLIRTNPSGKSHLRILPATVPMGLVNRGLWTRSSSRWARLGRACFLRDIPPTRLNQFAALLVALALCRRGSRRPSTVWIGSVGSTTGALVLVDPPPLPLPPPSPAPRDPDEKQTNAWSV